MVVGFAANQHASMRCWVFVTVHQQFVHVPFALRAAWRLTNPALGYFGDGTARRTLDALFWASWMVSCGYRSLLVFGYCAYCYVRLGWRWQPAVGVACASTLASLDANWTRAMWPARPAPDAAREARFQRATRAAFFAGAAAAALAVATDVAPALLPAWRGAVEAVGCRGVPGPRVAGAA